jgi:hypothetical protein
MELTCHRRDLDRFTALGFHFWGEDDGALIVELTDEEANFGHAARLPTDVPFFAAHGSGDNYGPHLIACDGNRLIDIPGDAHEFQIDWDYQTNSPSAESIKQIRDYLAVKANAAALLAGQLV